MIFVTGGAYSGKENFSKELLHISEDEWNNDCARGGADEAKEAPSKPYIADYHLFVREILNEGRDALAFTEELISKDPRIVIMDEVGCGVLPVSKKERDYRETAGCCAQLLASAAKEVYCVVSGIGTRIK